ncbi:selenium-dependent xanthine dehydrogenase, partial [bacterium DOLJORAL78_65_58]
MVRFTLNGQEMEYDGNSDMSLLRYLRDVAGLKSVKDGCSGEGTCGACIVEKNGKPNLSCRVPMKKLEGADLVTLEGVPEETVRFLGEAFVEAGAVQCGFCSPGMLTRTKLLLAKNPNPTREEVTKKIKSHLCRCTGYVKIVDGVMNASRAMNGEQEPELINLDSPRKFTAYERVVGKPLFIGGMDMEGMLHGALHFSEHPRARIIKIDTSRAEAVPGVVRVFTAKDVPGRRNIGMIISDWDAYIAEGEITRYIGDVLAMVVAETNQIAREAAALVDVEYEVLEAVTDPFEALKDEIKVHEGGNLLKETKIAYGEDIDKVLADSAYVVGDTFETQLVEHAFLELENSVACYEDGRLTVYSQGQGIYEDRHQIADLLGLEPADLNVKLVPAGGAFGGKEDLSVQGHAALGAFILKCPVKVKLNRSESLRMHPKRHPMVMEYKMGCDESGKFTGLY